MLKTPRQWAHFSFGLVAIGLVVNLIIPEAFWISLVFWAASVTAGVITLVKNGRVIPATAQVMGWDKEKLGILGFIEVYVAFVPAITVAAMLVFLLISGKSG